MAITTAAAISAGVSLASAGAGFAQAAKEKRLMRDAQEAAAKYMEEAKTKIDVNYMEQLQVPLEGYEAAARQNLAIGMQSTDMLRESGQRALIGGVGKVNEQGQRFAEDQRIQMQRDLYDRDRLIAQEDSRIANQLAGLNLQQAEGAQIAAAQSDMNRAASIQGAFGNITDAATTTIEGLDLYKKGKTEALDSSGFRVTPGQLGVKNSSLYDKDLAGSFNANTDLASAFSIPGANPSNPFIYNPFKIQ
jgi:hypothetical protein